MDNINPQEFAKSTITYGEYAIHLIDLVLLLLEQFVLLGGLLIAGLLTTLTNTQVITTAG